MRVRSAPLIPALSVLTPLGGGTVDGVTISGFREMLDPHVFESAASLSGIAPTGSLGIRGAAAASAAQTVAAEVFIAANGLPVRTRLVQVSGPVRSLVQIDVPAINFPLTVEAPPPAQTIGLAELKRLERTRRRSVNLPRVVGT